MSGVTSAHGHISKEPTLPTKVSYQGLSGSGADTRHKTKAVAGVEIGDGLG
jgi:hypothetical protein